MKKKLLFIFLILCQQFVSARATCDSQIDSIGSLNLDWNSLSSVVPVQVSMRRNTDANSFYCYLYSYGFSRGNSSTYNRYMENFDGDRIDYNIYNTNSYQNILFELEDTSQNADAIWGWSVSTNQVYTDSFNFQISLDDSIIYPSGYYFDTVAVKLYSGLPKNSPELEDIVNLNVFLYVPPEVSLSLVEVGGSFDESKTTYLMDFGELTQGESLEADLKVMSNAGYNIYMSSENRGKLKHTSGSDTVNYRLYLNGSRVRLNRSTPRRVADGTGVTPVEGENFRVRVEIRNIPNNAQAGTYTDYITITAETKE